MPFHEFRAVPLLHRCLNPSDGSPEKASYWTDAIHPPQNRYSREQESFMAT